ncbi:MAG: S8 family serine peptidase [Clostridia bacterium]|nr:S8 family serine peptidase [Clostridia bacterium]
MNKKILTSITLLFILAVICTAVLPTSVAEATQYGDVNSDDCWYYKSAHLNVAGMKEAISGWIGDADKSKPVIIGVIDTGVNVDHDVFKKTNTIFTVDGKAQGYNAHIASNNAGATIDQLSSFADGSSTTHGTAVASIMAMLIYDLGLQDYIKLYPIKASRDNTNKFPTSAVVKGLEFVKNSQSTLGIDVVNLSIAGYSETAEDYNAKKQLFAELSVDTIIVAAAGNENASLESKPCYPAVLDGVVSVMAYGKDGAKHSTSNYGAYDVIAPGQEIRVAKGNGSEYTTDSGTSMASAFVSVASAVVKLREQTAGSNANATIIARHMLTSSKTSTIKYGDYNLSRFDGYAAVHNSITETYLEPTGVEITNNKDLKDGATIYCGQHKDLELYATLLPFGNTSPQAHNDVVWTQTEILSRQKVDEDGNETEETEEYDGATVELGKGKKLNYFPKVNGKYRITASYKKGEEVLSSSMVFNVEYVDYTSVAGILQVKPTTDIEKGFVYEMDTTTFYLAGSEGLDPSVEIKWYVNGEHVYTGATYTHKAGANGDYEITAQYGNYRVVENGYTIKVESGFLRPAVWISFTAVVATIAIVLGVVFGVILPKRKAKKTE